MLKIQNVRGCYDYLPEVQNLRNYVIDTLKQIFIAFQGIFLKPLV